MCSKTVVFRHSAPPDVYHLRTSSLWADAIFPMVGVGKAATRPTQVSYLQFFQCFNHVISHSFGIGNFVVVFSYIKSTIDAVTQVLGKVTIDVFVNNVLCFIRINDDPRFILSDTRNRNDKSQETRRQGSEPVVRGHCICKEIQIYFPSL